VEQALARLRGLTARLQARGADAAETGAAASDYLRLFALVCFGWMWARMAATATRGGDTPQHAAKLAVARFFIARVLPQTAGLEAAIDAGAAPLMRLPAGSF
jgi:hypothetical protein